MNKQLIKRTALSLLSTQLKVQRVLLDKAADVTGSKFLRATAHTTDMTEELYDDLGLADTMHEAGVMFKRYNHYYGKQVNDLTIVLADELEEALDSMGARTKGALLKVDGLAGKFRRHLRATREAIVNEHGIPVDMDI